jgi:DNA-binding PadR family transcriptional regulator
MSNETAETSGAETEPVRLSPTSYVVLGLIALRGASTPYDLKRAVGRSVGYFWPFPHSQLYGEPDRLVRAGLLVVEREPNGRRRKTFSITAAGREAVKAWLREPVGEAFQLRNMAELKLFFAELGDGGNVGRLAHEQIQLHEARLAEFDSIDHRYANAPVEEIGSRLVPLQLGRELELAALNFWRRLAANHQLDEP